MSLPVRPPHRLAACTLLTLLAALLTGWSRPAAASAAPAHAAAPPSALAASLPAVPAAVPAAVPGRTAFWVPPLAGPLVVTRPFQPPAGPYGPGHRGVDLAGFPGEAVRSAGPGTVVYAGLLAGRGVVSVDHGHLRTTYEPVAPLVRPGATVTAGQVLGRLVAGHPGCPLAACLHWGLLRGQVYLDPMSLLTRSPPVLLPLQAGTVPNGATTPLAGPPDLDAPAARSGFPPAGSSRPGEPPRGASRAAALGQPLTAAAVGAASVAAGLLLPAGRRRTSRR